MVADLSNLPVCRFPEGFWFGSATAGHQIEGDNAGSQEYYEELANPQKALQGRVPSGKACDHWNRWREDIDLLAQMEHQAWRFSIEWSRVEPRQGALDEEAVAHYVAVCEALVERKIRPVITLCHWTHPQWFEALGGFTRDANLGLWEQHVDRVARRFAPYAAAWVTLNEVEAAAGGRMERARGYGRGHAIAYHALKQYSAAPAGMAGCGALIEPRRANDEADRALAAWRQWQYCDWWLHMIRTGEVVLFGHDAQRVPEAKGAADWWMLNCYRRNLADARRADGHGTHLPWTRRELLRNVPAGDRKAQDLRWDEINPECLLRVLDRLRDKPVLITENGVATDDDRWRVVSLARHLAAAHEAIQRGVDLRGYLHWSTMDNFEWGSFVPRFGLVHVDYQSFKRTPKPSAYFFRDVIRANGLTPQIVAEYA